VDDSIREDMTECHPVVSQDLADEQATVALLRLPLAAKQRDPTLASTAQEALNRHLEPWLPGHAIVASVAVLVVILLPRWPAAELLPEEEIARAGPAERRIELLTVELRCDARVRVGPHVYDDLDALDTQELRKVLKRVVGMPDRPDHGWRLHGLRVPRLTDGVARLRSPVTSQDVVANAILLASGDLALGRDTFALMARGPSL